MHRAGRSHRSCADNSSVSPRGVRKPALAMSERILITGGAGFIGSHLADELLMHGYQVRVLDSLVEQVHERGLRPDYLADEVELVQGDVREQEAVARALRGVDA